MVVEGQLGFVVCFVEAEPMEVEGAVAVVDHHCMRRLGGKANDGKI